MAGPVHLEILHVLASLEGGAARHVLYLAREMRSRGHRTAVAAPSDQPSVKMEMEGSGFPFFELPQQAIPSVQKIVSILNSQPFTHLHVHGHRAAFLGRMAKDKVLKKIPLIYTVHGYHPFHYQNPAKRWVVNGIERIYAPRTDAFICVSASTHEELLQSVPSIENHCHIVENGIPLNTWSEEEFQAFRSKGRQDFQLSSQSIVLGTVARLHWQKGISRLMEAFKRVEQKHPHARLLIVGDGPDKSSLEKLAKSLELGPKCILAGKFTDIHKIYPIMDLFVLPSLWEGLPLTVLEAWNAGIPVVATDVPGTQELIEDNVTGFLAENSIEGIEQAIYRAMEAKDRYAQLVQSARTRLHEQYSLAAMVQKTEQIYLKTFPRKNVEAKKSNQTP